MSNRRNDFQHKLSFKLVIENQPISVETLDVKGMITNHHFAQAIYDLAWSNFVTKLDDKSEW
jgi:putative transposase